MISDAAAQFHGSSRFRIVRMLGEGGMGTVFEAEDTESGERVALKTLSRNDPTGLLRFKREFRAVADIQHENLCRLGELHEGDGVWFISMELVQGTDLLEYVRGRPHAERAENLNVAPYDEGRLRSAFRQLAAGLAAMHAAGRVHRDIKPSNVRVTPEGRVVILDFGLVVDRAEYRASTADLIVGTVVYMAPEQAASAPVGAAADWYAFGVVLYEALTGFVPFNGGGIQILMDKTRRVPDPPRAHFAGAPEDLDALCSELLRLEPQQRPSGAAVLARLGAPRTRTSAPPSRTWSLQDDGVAFTGRASELRALRSALACVRGGSTVTVSVEGLSGIGKSALVSHFLEQLLAEDPTAVVLRGRCYERETARFKGVDGVVDVLATRVTQLPIEERYELVPRNAALLTQLFPVLGRVDAIAHAPRSTLRPRDQVEERRWMFASLRELMSKLAARSLLVLIIDDMHWADGDSLELLRALLDSSREPPPRLLLLVTAWTRWQRAGAADAASDPWPVPMSVIDLSPLTDEESQQLASVLLTLHPQSRLDPAQIAREAAGHPLFLAELARSKVEWRRDANAVLTLEDAIWARAERLPEPALCLLKVLAIASSPLASNVLSRAAELSQGELERQMGILRIAAFARGVAGTGARRFEIYHERIRVAVLRQLQSHEFVRLHATLAPLLAQEPGVDPEQVAQHYLDAGDREKAAELFDLAARRAEQGFAFERCALLLRLRLGLSRLPDAQRSEIFRRIGTALAQAGQAYAAAEAYEQACEGASGLARINLRYLAASHLLRSGHITEGLEQLDAVLVNVGLAVPKTRAVAIALFLWERMRLRIIGYEPALRNPSLITPQQLARADALFSVAQGLAWVDGIRAAPLVSQALRVALAAGDRDRIVKALSAEAVMMSMLGRETTQLTALTQLMRKHVADVESSQVRGLVTVAEASIAYNLSDFYGCYEKATQAIALLEVPGLDAQWERSSARLYRLFSQLYLGKIAEMRREADEAMLDAESRRDRWLASLLRMTIVGYARLAFSAESRDVSAIRASIEQGYGPWRDREPGLMHANWVLQSMAVDLCEGRFDQVLARRASEGRALWQSGALRVVVVGGGVHVYTAVAHLMEFAARGTPSSLRGAETAVRALGTATPFGAAFGAVLRSQIALARGQQTLAIELAREGVARFGERRSAMQEAAAQLLLARLIGGEEGSRLRTAAASYFEREGMPPRGCLLATTVPYAFPERFEPR